MQLDKANANCVSRTERQLADWEESYHLLAAMKGDPRRACDNFKKAAMRIEGRHLKNRNVQEHSGTTENVGSEGDHSRKDHRNQGVIRRFRDSKENGQKNTVNAENSHLLRFWKTSLYRLGRDKVATNEAKRDI